MSFTDGTYQWYEEEASDTGALFGAYHFGHPELENGRAEAEHFMTVAKPQSARSLWYDYEVYGASPQGDADAITAFIEAVKLEHPHARVGIYFNRTGARRLSGRDVPFDAIWLAEPTGQLETPDHPLAQYGWAWSIHQYETFAGVDRNYSRWTKDQFRQFFGNWPAA
jgi:GH25 family lysozyme M1 (1,4-beta-N-acetylmuramidase)